MQARSLLITTFFFLSTYSYSQTGILTGKITDASNNQQLVGATVSIKDHHLKTVSDVDGVYRLGNLSDGKYSLEITYVGYTTKQVSEAEIRKGQVTTLNIALDAANNNLKTVVVVTTQASRESINSILNTRKNAAVVSDAISADMIKRSPDKNVSDILKRVSGTSIQENKFVIVRGMSDRYNEAMLNGCLLPSTEADRKTFAFDIFPSDIIDNITVIKSASAEYPGSFSGGLINVNLKEVPDKNFISVKTGVGYNTITTGKEFTRQPSGGLDFLGLDNGTRALPANFPSSEEYNALAPGKQNEWAQQLKNDWALNRDPSAPLNSKLELSGAFTHVGNKGYPRIGALFAVSYNSTYKTSHFDNNYYGTPRTIHDSISKGDTYYEYKDTLNSRNILSSALANFTIKVSPNSKFFFNNLLAINSYIQTTTRGGLSEAGTGVLSPYVAYVHYFQSNALYNGQFGGEHYLSKYKLRIKWTTYLTELHRNEPDMRQMIYYTPFEGAPMFAYLGYPTTASTTVGGLRMYYDTKDETKGINVDLNKAFNFLSNPQTFKFGFASFWDTRRHDGRFLRNDPTTGNFDQSIYFLPPAQIFDQKNFDPQTGLVLTDFGERQWYFYYGDQKSLAGYAMFDNKLTSKLRLSWGLRVEDYSNTVHSFKEAKEKYVVDTSFLDYLPSANLIYSILPKANIRLSYSKTVARPLYRELAATQFYDFNLNATLFGTNLLETKVDNYEIRWEQYFPNAQYYSLSTFYKKFQHPIEQKIITAGADSKTITWQNAPTAEDLGVELEARKNLDFIHPSLGNFYLYGNAALITSTAFVAGNGSDTANRPLQGQSPYVVNASLQYSDARSGITASALYNIIGERIFLVGGLDEQYIWEKPHAQLDFKVSKTFAKNGIVELSFSDLLHQKDIWFWDLNSNKKYDAGYPDVLIQSRSFGTTATLSIGYRF
ncbi:MAG TPA: TonB-dependent receptor [Parafilimonas sp.]|nr:TonB-dependent receptor [Parafilimonas sp.]